MKILIASSEISPVVKTGGLADMVAALALELNRSGIETALALPNYGSIDIDSEAVCPIEIPIGDATVAGAIRKSVLPDSSIPLYLISQDSYFGRKGIYNEDGLDYPDNLERFVFFSRAVIEIAKNQLFTPDLIHCNDWQTALIPVYLKTLSGLPKAIQSIPALYTIHNLAYQGLFPPDQYPILGIGWEHFHMDELEFYNSINLMKGGIVFADALTTVSPTYAKEILSEEFGCGLEGTLKKRESDTQGILNGVDYSIWSPDTDPYMKHHYSADNVAEGKRLNKKALRKALNMDAPKPDQPMIGVVSRFAIQKGLDLAVPLLSNLIGQGAQLAILGSGDPALEAQFKAIQAQRPGQFGLLTGYSEQIAHSIEAGSDMFLMPSRYEPCGLNQMYSLKYGALPIVHKTGGLADTILDADENPKGNGFVFEPHLPEEFLDACNRAIAAYQDKPRWNAIVQRAMRQDFSWTVSCKKYIALYKTLLK